MFFWTLPPWEIASSENIVTSKRLQGTFFVTDIVMLCYNMGGVRGEGGPTTLVLSTPPPRVACEKTLSHHNGSIWIVFATALSLYILLHPSPLKSS